MMMNGSIPGTNSGTGPNQSQVQQQQQQPPPPILVNGPNGTIVHATVPLGNGTLNHPHHLQQQQHHHHPQHGSMVPNGTIQQQASPNMGNFTYYNPRHHYQANNQQQRANNLSGQSQQQQRQQQQQQQQRVSVVIGRTADLTRTPPSKCCLCCCCLLPLWYNNCNIYRVIALICNLFVDLLMMLCLLSTNWLTTVKYRQGLWQYCIDSGSPRPLPFGIEDHDGCHWGRDVAYIKLAGFFAVSCFVLALIATMLTSFGLSSRDPNRKYTFYRFSLYINLAALLAIIVSLTLYPAFFYTELHHTNAVPANRPHWYFGWAYGVGWGSAIFLVGAILLLVCDKETEEIYYKERTIVHTNTSHQHHHSILKA